MWHLPSFPVSWRENFGENITKPSSTVFRVIGISFHCNLPHSSRLCGITDRGSLDKKDSLLLLLCFRDTLLLTCPVLRNANKFRCSVVLSKSNIFLNLFLNVKKNIEKFVQLLKFQYSKNPADTPLTSFDESNIYVWSMAFDGVSNSFARLPSLQSKQLKALYFKYC